MRQNAGYSLACHETGKSVVHTIAKMCSDIEYGRVAQLVAHLFSILTTVRHLVYRRSRVQFPARPIFLCFVGMAFSSVPHGWLVLERRMHRVERDVARPQKYEKPLLHFLQIPLNWCSTPVGSM